MTLVKNLARGGGHYVSCILLYIDLWRKDTFLRSLRLISNKNPSCIGFTIRYSERINANVLVSLWFISPWPDLFFFQTSYSEFQAVFFFLVVFFITGGNRQNVRLLRFRYFRFFFVFFSYLSLLFGLIFVFRSTVLLIFYVLPSAINFTLTIPNS